MTLRAIHYPDRKTLFTDQLPGSFWLSDPGDGGVCAMIFFCPCGCGDPVRITVGVEHKPITSPAWNWNGSTAEPTLKPSVRRSTDCKWHGWLTDGEWREC